ncbi:MAG: DUF2344 domain-containing protein [Phycisphaerales bacterium]|nr:DUF2344 domain-containing protein [Phycisphaerales bacterium]
MTAVPPQVPPPAAPLWAEVVYALRGELRYLSHQDELRMLQRAVVRAGWPLAFSRGFNPQPRVRIPLPRNLGLAAAQQFAWCGLQRAEAPASLQERLGAALPGGVRLERVHLRRGKVTPQVRAADYWVTLRDDAPPLGTPVAELQARATCIVPREFGPGRAPGTVDIRPSLEELEWVGSRLRFRLRTGAPRTARPVEVLHALGLAPELYHDRLERGEVLWTDTRSPDTGASADERT